MQDQTKLFKTKLGCVTFAGFAAFSALLILGYAVPTSAQTATISASKSAPAPALQVTPQAAQKTITLTSSVETWDKLTSTQKTALQPLSANWATLPEGQKRKWLAVSANFAQFSALDKVKLHSRMTEWSGLSAKQREQARINFAQTKTLTPQDKQAKWETYKALPPETKQALANIDVAPKPTGVATAAKPVAKDKLVASSPKTDKSTLR
jgi:hypothetical protein